MIEGTATADVDFAEPDRRDRERAFARWFEFGGGVDIVRVPSEDDVTGSAREW